MLSSDDGKVERIKSGKKYLGVGGILPPLEGAIMGEVVTRFPPEPSGYLHIGHVKAVLLNEYYARRYQGRLLLRFDDTNPNKEKAEFEDAIIEDLAMLGVRPDSVSHTSDYFELIMAYARKAVADGNAYMDDTPQDEMRISRSAGTDTIRRSESIDVNLERFDTMLRGGPEALGWCLRAKFDMKHKNYTLRDPVLVRGNQIVPHLRTGFRFKAYPTYDFACPIVDAFEGVTHAMRTTEYSLRDEQYTWIARMLNIRVVRIVGFSRMNFTFAVLSKRKLSWFVDTGRVSGWDDPRFPTIRGVLRRGVQVEALRDYVLSMGFSKKEVEIEWAKFWATNKKLVDPTAHRYFAIDAKAVSMEIINGPDYPEASSIALHPKDTSQGFKTMIRSKQIFIERDDANKLQPGEEFTLSRWMNAIVTDIIHSDISGEITLIKAKLHPEGDVRNQKIVKIGWIADIPEKITCSLVEFDYLITKPKLEDNDNIEDFVNEYSRAETIAIGEPALKHVHEGQIIQLERRGYFRVDRPYIDTDKPLILFSIPTGRIGAQSNLSTKITLADQKAIIKKT